MSAGNRGAGNAPLRRRVSRRWRVLLLVTLATTASALVFVPRAEARAAGAGRMATASVGAANRAAVGTPARPAQLPATPGDGRPERRDGGYGWYYGYAYGSNDEEPPADDHAIDVERAAAAAAAAAVAAAAVPAPPAAGTVVYALEPGCSTVERNGAYLRYCGGVYYQEVFEGDRVAFRVVNP
jgi:hypothetical protein